MLLTYSISFISVIVVSLISFVGVFFLALQDELLKKYVGAMISLAVGALLGDAFIHLIPEALEKFQNKNLASILVIFGIIFFFIVEKFFHWHHHEDDTEKKHIHPVGKLVLITDGFHNLIDGIIIGVSYLVSIPVGIATTLAVILHEIPQEVGDFAVLVHSGYSKKKALWLNFISALTAVIGLFLAIIFGTVAQNITLWFIPIAAGGFIYIAVADLIPELHKTKNIKHSISQVLISFIGIFLMVLLTLFE